MGSVTFYVPEGDKKLKDWLASLPKHQMSEAICEALHMHLPDIIEHRIAHHAGQVERWQGVKSIHETKEAERQALIKDNLDTLANLLELGMWANGKLKGDQPRDSHTLRAWLFGHKHELDEIGLTEDEFISLAEAVLASEMTAQQYLKKHPPIV